MSEASLCTYSGYGGVSGAPCDAASPGSERKKAPG